ncbi:uncharacterized protein LOC105702920 [Orussus abietinus]|uniref:uncharacterized protein LOC105702920 n=1 Tax=Orussus abietinus TaxID=222816 RepID=UPI0006250105|nr:uncharacterized protein LOC105702920 [Orussus abietinus]
MEFLRPYVSSRQVAAKASCERPSNDVDTMLESFVENVAEEEVASAMHEVAKEKTLLLKKNIQCMDPGGSEVVQQNTLKPFAESLDAVDLLFLSYAQTLKTFVPRRQAEIKLQIAQIMSNAEVAQLEEGASVKFSI